MKYILLILVCLTCIGMSREEKKRILKYEQFQVSTNRILEKKEKKYRKDILKLKKDVQFIKNYLGIVPTPVPTVETSSGT